MLTLLLIGAWIIINFVLNETMEKYRRNGKSAKIKKNARKRTAARCGFDRAA